MIINLDTRQGGSGSGSTVSWNQIQTTGTEIAKITINGTQTSVKAPEVDLGDYYTSAQTDTLLAEKQDTLTAGDNITISNNVISAAGGGGLEVVHINDIDTAKGLEIYANPEKYAIIHSYKLNIYYGLDVQMGLGYYKKFFPLRELSNNSTTGIVNFSNEEEIRVYESGQCFRYMIGGAETYNKSKTDTLLAEKVSGNGVQTIWKGTEAEYEAIATPSETTLYIITPDPNE